MLCIFPGDRIQKIRENADAEVNVEELNLPEQEILVQSVCETMVPKLVAEDIPLLFSLLSDVFPGIKYTRAEMEGLKKQIRKVCQEQFLSCGAQENSGTLILIFSILICLICIIRHNTVPTILQIRLCLNGD